MMPLKKGYSRVTIAGNIAEMVAGGKAVNVAIAAAHAEARKSFFARNTHGTLPSWIYPARSRAKVRKNPAPRGEREAAAKLLERFAGRAPDFEDRYPKPKMPSAMAGIGKTYAIEYLAERDGKVYRFRHVFRKSSRPQLAVSPDGTFVTMLGGAWKFGEDGFVDL